MCQSSHCQFNSYQKKLGKLKTWGLNFQTQGYELMVVFFWYLLSPLDFPEINHLPTSQLFHVQYQNNIHVYFF